MTQPPFHLALEPGEDEHQDQIHDCGDEIGIHGLVGVGDDGLGEVDDLLAADDVDQGGVLQQGDELVAQGGEDGLEGLGDDDEPHGVKVSQAQGPARLGLSDVQGHEAAPDDLGHIGPRVDAQGQGADHGLVPAAGEDDQAHDQQLYHHGGAPDDGYIDLAHEIDEPQEGIPVSRALLVVGGTDHGHQHAQNDAQAKGHDGHLDGGDQTVEVHGPPVLVEPGFVELHVGLLPEAGVLQGVEGLIQLGKIHWRASPSLLMNRPEGAAQGRSFCGNCFLLLGGDVLVDDGLNGAVRDQLVQGGVDGLQQDGVALVHSGAVVLLHPGAIQQ